MTVFSSNLAARRIRPVAVALWLALAAVASPPSAHAGWQGAAWGVSAPQVDRTFRVPHQRLPATARQEYSADIEQVIGLPLITFSYSAGQFAFDHGEMFFRSGKLFTIEMSLVRGQECGQLAATLGQALGQPREDSAVTPPNPAFSTRSIEWDDSADDNLVHLFLIKDHNPGFTDECTLSLYPLRTQPVS